MSLRFPGAKWLRVHASASLLIAALAVAGCHDLAPPEGRTVSHAIESAGDTPLGQATLAQAAAHPGLSGIHALSDGRSAFATRELLIKAAQRTLDVQYYIWHDDISGTLLLQSLLEAAQRGVRVRLLLDDNGTAGLDAMLAALDGHPNLEVRLYNPFVQRTFKPLGYLTDFRRLNRRMHNKSLIADNAAAIVGGRNVGDEYFGAAKQADFADLDLIAVGAVVTEVSGIFDQYWSSQSAYPLSTVVKRPPADATTLLQARRAQFGGESAVSEYAEAVKNSTVVRELLSSELLVEWVVTRVLADDPAKTLGQAASGADPRLMPRLKATVGEPESRFDVVSPYFVPMASGTETFAELVRRGVQVRVLTNSLSATDVPAVQAGYAKRREALLRAGVKLFELKATAAPAGDSGNWVAKLGGSAASLHAKTFAVDGRRAFVGTFNFDPRSAELNTEMGFVVDSPSVAGQISHAFETILPQVAYEVRLGADGQLRWVDRDGDAERILTTEPGAGALKRALVRVLSWLPIDSLL